MHLIRYIQIWHYLSKESYYGSFYICSKQNLIEQMTKNITFLEITLFPIQMHITLLYYK